MSRRKSACETALARHQSTGGEAAEVNMRKQKETQADRQLIEALRAPLDYEDHSLSCKGVNCNCAYGKQFDARLKLGDVAAARLEALLQEQERMRGALQLISEHGPERFGAIAQAALQFTTENG